MDQKKPKSYKIDIILSIIFMVLPGLLANNTKNTPASIIFIVIFPIFFVGFALSILWIIKSPIRYLRLNSPEQKRIQVYLFVVSIIYLLIVFTPLKI